MSRIRTGKKHVFGALIAAAMLIGTIGFAQEAKPKDAEAPKPAPDRQSPARHTGLLILSHGSPESKWNSPVNALIDRVRQKNEEAKTFHAIQGAFLELAQPDAATSIKELEAAGCDSIIVVPLLIAPSSHSHFDVPAVLGLYSSPSIRTTLEKEGAHVAAPKVPLTLIQTLSEGDLLDCFVRDEVRALSKDPANEAIVLISHGCPDHHNIVERMNRRVATYCCGQSGIDYADWIHCGVGQTFWEEAAPAIQKASEHKKRVLVIGLYISTSAGKIYASAKKVNQHGNGGEQKEQLEGINVVFSEKGIVDYPATADWLLGAATEAVKN